MNAVASAVHTTSLNQMLTFALDNASYAVDIQRVQEIRCWSPVTPIPQAPRDVLGVLNLRGSVVPIIDLRARLGMTIVPHSATTVIIVLSVETAADLRLFGIVVDRVSDVANLDEQSLQPVPPIGNTVSAHYLRGLFNLGDTMTLLLDIDTLLGGLAAPLFLQ